jgi:hypothetical protein
VFIEGQVGDESLEPRILVLERSQLAELTDAEVRVRLFPDVERGFADAHAAHIRRRRSAFDLAEHIGDLLFGELRFLHRSSSSHRGPRSGQAFLVSTAVVFGGERH